MKSEDMNEGIRLLLERMKTNPEEFDIEDGGLYSSNKWGKLVHDALRDEVFSEGERSAVREAFCQVRRNNFTSDVLRTLTATAEDFSSRTITYKPAMTLSSSGSLGIGTVTPSFQLGSTTLSEDDLKQIKSMTINPHQQRK